MNTISSASQALMSLPLSNTTRSTNLDYDAFLKLLIAQMKNQDPTKPMESTEYIAQLTSFSNLEQSVNVNKKLDSLINMTRISQGFSLIGKNVSSSEANTSGMVSAVRFTSESIIALLNNGVELKIDESTVISNEPD